MRRSAGSSTSKTSWRSFRRTPKFEAVISSVTPEELDTVRSKIGAAAYTFGGQNVSDLFNKIDKDHSGGLDEEFIGMVRRNLRLPSHTISDGQVAAVFRAIDVDGSGTIELDELIAFTTKSNRCLPEAN